MALFPSQQQGQSIDSSLQNLRMQGLTGEQIVNELKGQGFHEAQIMAAVNKMDSGAGAMPPAEAPQSPSMDYPSPAMPPSQSAPVQPQENLYDRIEEIAEGLVDEKWDELIVEVKKVIAWKEKVEEENHKLKADVSKLKEDFKTLHQAVLGKVEEYDKRMQDVGTELKAVGKVFKDVVPVFTENVKELSSITSGMKKSKK